MNWEDLKKDSPQEIAYLCDIGEIYSTLLVNLTLRPSIFQEKSEAKSLEEPTIKQYSNMLFCFEKLRQNFATVVKTKSEALKRLPLVPIEPLEIKEEEGKKRLEVPISSYIKRFDEDLEGIAKEIKPLFKGITVPSLIELNYQLKRFETYVFDILFLTKQNFYKQTNVLPYEKRDLIKRRVRLAINWILLNLDDACKWFLDIESELNQKEVENFFVLLTDVLSKISVCASLNKLIMEPKDRYKSFFIILGRIKDNQLYIKSEEKEEEQNIFYLNNFDQTLSLFQKSGISFEYIKSKIGIAGNFPFKQTLMIGSKEIDSIFLFPTEEDEVKFWEIFLSIAIQRAGVIPVQIEKKEEHHK